MKKERIDEIDILRGMAFMAIALQHVIGEFIYRSDILQQDSIMLAMLFHFTRFGTPTFVFLSGLILFYNYYDRPIRYGSFIRKRFMDIYMPFVMWTCLYFLLLNGWSLQDSGSAVSFAKEFITPSNGYHLWFIVMIFQFYLLFPWFVKLVKKGESKLHRCTAEGKRLRIGGSIIIFTALFTALLYSSYYILPGWHAKAAEPFKTLIQYRNMNFIFHSFYFAIGGFAALALAKWRQAVLKYSAWSILVFSAAYIWMGYNLLDFSTARMNLNVSTYLKPSTFILIVSQQLIMYAAALKITELGNRLYTMMKWIGTYSFGAFLIHPLAIWLLAVWTRPADLTGIHLGITIVFYLGVVVLSLAASYGLSKLPFGFLLTGTTGRKRRNPGNTLLAQPQTNGPGISG